MKKLVLAIAAMVCVTTSSAWALDKELDELNLTVFQSVDANEDGMVSKREVELFRELVMLSMDANNDEKVTLDEYMSWDMGWDEIAKERNKLAGYRQARKEVFEEWDSDEDGNLSQSEQILSQSKVFYSDGHASDKPMDLDRFTTDLRIIAAMNDAVAGTAPVILINAFTVPDGKEEKSIRFWEESAKFLSDQPGYISTALHQTILPDAKFHLINIAKWENVETFESAIKIMRKESGIKIVEGLIPNASLYKVIRSD